MTKTLAVLSLLALAACNPLDEALPDQCLRARIFRECLASVPVGPTHVVSNDWADVVAKCESTSYYQSLRAARRITPECRFTP